MGSLAWIYVGALKRLLCRHIQKGFQEEKLKKNLALANNFKF